MTGLFLTQRRRGAEGAEGTEGGGRAELARSAPKKCAVILNGVSPWAEAGAKRSEESLKVMWAEAAGVMTRVPVPPPPPAFQSAILHSVPVAKPPGTPFRMTAFFSTLRSASPSASPAPLRLCIFKNLSTRA